MRVRQGKLARLAQSAETLQRIGSAQTDALFKAVPVGVGAAAIASILLLAILRQLGSASWIGPAWSLFVVACALGHILLARAYARARPKGDEWRKWALWCSAVSFAEGLAWGWAPIGLATGGLEVELVVLAVTLAVAEGAMVAFGAYLPAFYALFFPATVPYALVSALSSNPLERLTSLLMLVFVCAIAALGYTTNRSFIQIVGLRIRTEKMALDLQKQKDIAEREREVAEAANVAKSSFLAAASHDLRQPIHALGMFVGALRGVPMVPEGRRIVAQIEASTAAMDGPFFRASRRFAARRGRGGRRKTGVRDRTGARAPLPRPSGRSQGQGRFARLETMLGDGVERSRAHRARFAQPGLECGALYRPRSDRDRLPAPGRRGRGAGAGHRAGHSA